ncbi:unnamed protein product [Allacma fusca]|uniref:Uncharacterized protein n=1 Tax=Allacma fusca TaxID=39272 RepID=A0A8J2NYC0_9HEXA|nr:unnamed protein product [Allacma fusca]
MELKMLVPLGVLIISTINAHPITSDQKAPLLEGNRESKFFGWGNGWGNWGRWGGGYNNYGMGHRHWNPFNRQGYGNSWGNNWHSPYRMGQQYGMHHQRWSWWSPSTWFNPNYGGFGSWGFFAAVVVAAPTHDMDLTTNTGSMGGSNIIDMDMGSSKDMMTGPDQSTSPSKENRIFLGLFANLLGITKSTTSTTTTTTRAPQG